MLLKSVLILLLPLSLFAQNQNNQWFFGTFLGMRFSGTMMNIVRPHASPMDAPYGSASWSDPATGALLFYTNGCTVYNRMHEQMPNGAKINPGPYSPHTVIVPVSGSSRYYYIFSSPVSGNNIHYCKIDLQRDNGKGDVAETAVLPRSDYDFQFTAVKQLYDNGYWLIAHGAGSKRFYAYRVGPDGLDRVPVVSDAGRASFAGASFISGKMTSSSNGEQLLLTAGKYQTGYFAQLFYFDKRCGVVTAGAELDPEFIQAAPMFAYPCFSPNDKLAYVSWLYDSGQNFLVQYNLSDSSSALKRQVIATDNSNTAAGDLQLAPDHKIYVASAENGVVTPKISVITNPDRMGTGCDFRLKSINLLAGSTEPLFTEHFPEYIADISDQQPGYAKPRIQLKQLCLGDRSLIGLAAELKADSFLWDLGDGTTSKFTQPEHAYARAGAYPVTLTWYMCGTAYRIGDTARIASRPVISLGNDTTLCAGAVMELAGPPGADEYRWSTVDSVDRITVKGPGVYRLRVRNGGCWGEDEVRINYYPSLWIALGDEYFICDDEKELTKLDAGEGFKAYRWTPTGDTTQWIEVADLGAYFVVVKDFRGCTGNDGTIVKRRCPVNVFFPNAFTPNGDGLNDLFEPAGKDVVTFEMTIYNAWGEAVFETRSIDQKWDGLYKGRPAPAGVYIYKAYYEGYYNKRLKTFDQKGNITLLR